MVLHDLMHWVVGLLLWLEEILLCLLLVDRQRLVLALRGRFIVKEVGLLLSEVSF